jgi:hypothetical protein
MVAVKLHFVMGGHLESKLDLHDDNTGTEKLKLRDRTAISLQPKLTFTSLRSS